MGTISTAGSYTMAQLGIYAAQKAMQVTGNNITNINTEGYTRQRLDQQSMYLGGADRYSSRWEARVGGGVLCTGVSQLRDKYLDIRYRTESSSMGQMDTKLGGLQQLAGVFDEVGKGEDDEGVFEAQMNDLIAQLTEMGGSGAGDATYDTLVRTSADSLAKLFNTYAGKLQTIFDNTETAFAQEVDEVNVIMTKIQNLNDQIRKSDIHGGAGLELRDERNLLLDELSQYMEINVRYEPENIGEGVTIERIIVELASNDETEYPDGDERDHKGMELINGQFVRKFAIETNKDPDTGAETYDPTYTIKFTRLEDINGKPIKAEKEQFPNGGDFTDTDLHGSLQANRELLTEKGVYATDAEVAVDQDARTKYGIPYYQNMLDSLARKLAEEMNKANTLPDEGTSIYQFYDVTIPSMGKYTDEEGTNQLTYDFASGKFLDADGNQGVPAQTFTDASGQTLTYDAETGKYLDANGDEGTPVKSTFTDKDGNLLRYDAPTRKFVPATASSNANTNAVNFPGLKDADGNQLYYNQDDGKFYLADGKTEGVPQGAQFKDAEGNILTYNAADDKFTNAAGDEVEPVRSAMYSHYNGGPLFSNNSNCDDTNDITAANIAVSESWANGKVHVLQTKQPIDPNLPQSTQQDNVQYILHTLADKNFDFAPSDLDPNNPTQVFYTGNFQDMWGKICDTLASDTQTTTAQLNNYVSAINDLYADRDSISGVDLNDEAINMMKYNKAYSASCRLLTTLDEMLDKLINGTAV